MKIYDINGRALCFGCWEFKYDACLCKQKRYLCSKCQYEKYKDKITKTRKKLWHKYYAADPDKYCKRSQAWKDAHPEWKKAYSSGRWKKIKGDKVEWERVKARDNELHLIGAYGEFAGARRALLNAYGALKGGKKHEESSKGK